MFRPDKNGFILHSFAGRESGGGPSLHSGPQSLALAGAVGCMTTVTGGWRRKAVAYGHSRTSTDLHRAWSPAVRLGFPFRSAEFSCPRGQPVCVLGRQSRDKRAGLLQLYQTSREGLTKLRPSNHQVPDFLLLDPPNTYGEGLVSPILCIGRQKLKGLSACSRFTLRSSEFQAKSGN
jgi:hypothetical protein